MSKLEKALALYQTKEYAKALPIFKALAITREDTTESARIHIHLGMCYLYLDQLEEALNEFEQSWYFFDDTAFISNILLTANKFWFRAKADKTTSYHRMVHFLNEYVDFIGNDHKRDIAYVFLGLFSDFEDFNEEKTFDYYTKAFEINPNDYNRKNSDYITAKLEKSILGKAFVIPKHIGAILDKLKKSCQVIKKDLSNEIETGKENFFHIFSINNFRGINFPEEIKRLEIYFDDEKYEASFKIKDNFGSIDKEKNMLIENTYNLPDLMTLEELYPKEYEIVGAYLDSLQPKRMATTIDDDDEMNKIFKRSDRGKPYYQLLKKYLGHDLYHSFIGGNINQYYVDLYQYEHLNFLMQYQTHWGNGDIVFVFNTKENPLDIKIIVQH